MYVEVATTKVKRYKETEESRNVIGKGIVQGEFQKYPAVTQLLRSNGLLDGWPTQLARTDLTYDEGVDIKYRFRRMTPARFRDYSDSILLAAYTEAQRYEGEKYKFAKFEVKLKRNEKGRKSQLEPMRTYTCAKQTDAEVMVYGASALGYKPTYYPHGGTTETEQRSYLINKVEDILQIPDSTSPGPYVDKQNPYVVVSLTISIRAGLHDARKDTNKAAKAKKSSEIQNEDDL